MENSGIYRFNRFNGKDELSFIPPTLFDENSSRHWSRYIPDDVNEVFFIDFDKNLNFLQKLENRNLPTNGYYILFASKFFRWLESLSSPSEHFSDIRFRCYSEESARQILRLRLKGRLTVIEIPVSTNNHAVSVPIVIEMAKFIDLRFKISVMCKHNIIYVAQHYFRNVFHKDICIIENRPVINFEDVNYIIRPLSFSSSSNENLRVVSFIDENNVKLRRSRYVEPHDHFNLYYMNENNNRSSNGRRMESAFNISYDLPSISRHVTVDHHSRNALEIIVPQIDDCADIAIIIAMSRFDCKLLKDIVFEVRNKDKIFTAATYLFTKYGRKIELPDIENN